MIAAAMLLAATITAEPTPRVQWVVFSTANCVPCRELKADLALNLTKKAGWKVGMAETNYVRLVDAEKFPELAKRYGVTCYPTLVLLSDSREVERVEGKLSAIEVAKRFNAAVRGLK